ncbi:hypothetical protein CR973_02650 [Candidatus Saccharibacteria bacterium]|nr:MAG: hypothetical protein CR973_02650 [Candidatus Saccharibacteria bacterium]
MTEQCDAAAVAARPRLERGLFVAGAAAVAGKLAMWGAEVAYRRARQNRYTPEQLEAATAPSSIVPYLELVFAKAEQDGLELVLAGGIAKKALADPETEFDQEKKIMKVSDDPRSLARRNATILRPDELTERDIDIFCKYIWIGEGEDRRRVVADQADPVVASALRERAAELQAVVDEYAKEHGLDLGPEISVFGYDKPYGHDDFRLTDYASKTRLSADGKTETLFDNNGNRFEMPVDEQWMLQIGNVCIPVNSPQVQLGRTLTRTVVSRKRDIADVNAGIRNLKNKSLWSGKMVSMWRQYQEFRAAMDDSIRLRAIMHERNLVMALNLLGARALDEITEMVEESPLLCPAIRDRRGPVSRFAGWVMSASSGK